MKIYTKTGDAGETGLFGGPRVRKDHPRIEAYGTVDELNSVLGVVRTQTLSPDMDALLQRIQNELFDVGAELATPQAAARGLAVIGPPQIGNLEAAIDQYDAMLPPLKQFILPSGTPQASYLHLARTVCRRAERRVITLAATEGETVSAELIVYFNRLGDLLFVLARAANAAADCPDVPWQKTS